MLLPAPRAWPHTGEGAGCAPRPRTVLQDGFSLRAIDLLAPDEVAGGVSEIDETGLSVEVQCSGVHEVLDGDHVLIRHLGPHVHPADDAGTPLPVHQEQLVLGLCREKGAAPSPPARPGRAGASSQGGRNQKPLLALGPACPLPSPLSSPKQHRAAACPPLPLPSRLSGAGQDSLLQDFPSLPRLNPERHRQVRVLWLFPSRQISEQPPGLPNWSGSQAWLLTTWRESSGWGQGCIYHLWRPSKEHKDSLVLVWWLWAWGAPSQPGAEHGTGQRWEGACPRIWIREEQKAAPRVPAHCCNCWATLPLCCPCKQRALQLHGLLVGHVPVGPQGQGQHAPGPEPPKARPFPVQKSPD